MKKLVAFILFLLMLFTPLIAAYNEAGDPATPTDLEPVIYDYVIKSSNMPQYSIVAFNNAAINGHIRGSIYVGGTLRGSQFIDDGSINGVAASDSYVYNNESSVIFKGRTSEQGAESYRHLSATSGNNTASYWRNFITNLPNNETYIYLEPNESGVVDIYPYDYQANGSDVEYRNINKVYWTDATTVNMGGLAGHLIAPYATVNITWCNHCGSIVANNINTTGEDHVNIFLPPTPETSPSPSPSPTPTPTPITVTKVLKGEIWSLRCDTMDNTKFKAGGGYWMADINNPTHNTSKEGHRSNHCGNRENWVLFVNEEGKAISLYQLKSGSTGGTLPSIVYRAPADLCSIPEGKFIYDPTNPDDIMTQRLIEEVFIPQNAMPFSEINLVEGQRLFWISQNGNQVWHHTGVLKKTTPRFAFIINGEPYTLGVGETITLTEVEEGLLEIEEIATSNYKMVEITNDGEGNYVVINEINPPDKPTPTPPPPVVTPTPSPSPTPEESESPSPSPEVSESPSPSPEVSESPSPSPEISESPSPSPEISESPSPSPEVSESPSPSPEVSESPSPSPSPSPTPVGFTIRKIVPNIEGTEDVIFFFKVSGIGFEESEYIEVIVDAKTGIGSCFIEVSRAGKYSVEEIDIPDDYELMSDPIVTKYVLGIDMVFEFVNTLKENPSPSPSPEITETPTTSPIPSETPEESESPSPSPTPEESETPSPTPSPTPEETESPSPPPTTVTPSEVPSESPSPTPSPIPTPTVTTSPIPSEVIPQGSFRVYKEIYRNGRPYDIDGEVVFTFIVTAPDGQETEHQIALHSPRNHFDVENVTPGIYKVREIATEGWECTSAVEQEIEVKDGSLESKTTLTFTNIKVNVIPSESPTPIMTETPTPTVTTSPIPSPTPTPTAATQTDIDEPTETPTEEVTEEPTTTPMPVKHLTVQKIWDDEGYETNRPESVVVRLYGNYVYIHSYVITNNNYLSIEMPYYDEDGHEIEYTWSEEAVIGYTLEGIHTKQDYTTIINRVWVRPENPTEGKKPKTAGRVLTTITFEDYDTPLGVEIMINHVGDCFD